MNLINNPARIERYCGVDLWGRKNSSFNKRPNRPGQHGLRRRRKLSNYALQLIAKQKFRFYYGMKEGQFRRFFKIAMNKKGDTGINMIRMLESRLDNVVYRLKWSATIFGAKQLVSHGHILVNGSKVDVASYLVSAGDTVELKEKAKNMSVVRQSVDIERDIPSYLKASSDGLSGSLSKLPDAIEEVGYNAPMDMPLVIGMYSRLM
ncbi:30S ribosomal protein S4 [Candidatus Cytomitobacter indipagum]|uniref:Small ribosomal subunit protein uS4 n=1 Tax=Candidatus Cytomitobacter indipagum TaxID=2601575 RepID=A0A5C0UEK6_9PROT|nr:30S ribosomal protein S4 [Candidatus Cytomitobacter indipagum]QEK38111.1 30S ribosomal protein S4 [Candidatus Cytomitobacter indipagum]